MAGFFNLFGSEIKKEGHRETIQTVVSSKPKLCGSCDTCDLACGKADVPFIGKGGNGVLILSSHPMNNEDNERRCFASKMYDALFDLRGKDGIPEKLLADCWVGYVVPAQVSKKQEGDSKRSMCCADRVNRLIAKLRPKVIIALGIWPTHLLITSRVSGRMNGLKPSEFFGKCIPDRHYNCWICPTYGVDMLTWNDYKNDNAVKMYFKRHIAQAFAHADTPLPEVPDDWRVSHDRDEACLFLRELLKKADDGELGRSEDGDVDVAFDYETTGLKPHREGHEIKYTSVAWRETDSDLNTVYKAIGLQWYGDDEEFVSLWDRLLHHPDVKLVAHKCDFEATWTRFRGGLHHTRTPWLERDRWSWDTCIASHVIDNTQKVNLKFHTYCELGVLGYDADADAYLKPKDTDPTYAKSTNAFNALKSDAFLPHSKIQEYCAKDSLYTLYLRDVQVGQMEDKEMLSAYYKMLDWTVALYEIQSNGFPMDFGRVDAVKAMLDEKVESAVRAIECSDEYEKYAAVKGKPLNIQSNPQMIEWLYDILKLTPPNGTRDVTKDTLEKLHMPVTDSILEMRKWAKTRDTFIADYSREAVYDEGHGLHLVRPFFNLAAGASADGGGGPRTYRSSSDSPNFQNVPKHDKEMKKILRSLFIAPKGYRYMEVDYKALETYISESYNHDPTLLAYLKDPNLDMHRRASSIVFDCKPDEVTKDMRQMGKKWNFSSFYGSGYRNSAEHIWKASTPETKAFAASKGMDTYEKFEAQCKKAYDIYWGTDFKVYDEWRKDQWEIYQKRGELRSFYGFRFLGPMGPTNCSNVCIQGTGAHCLLEGMTRCLAEFKERKLLSRIIGEIHDSIVILVKDEEVDTVCSIVWKHNVEYLNKTCKWIVLPLVEECDLGKDGGSWAEMTEIGACTADGVEDKSWREKEQK